MVNLDEIFAYGRNEINEKDSDNYNCDSYTLRLLMRFLSSSCRGGTENPPPIVDSDNPGTTDPETPSATITITNGDGLHAPSDTVQLSYSLASGAVTWTSSNETLATVDSTGLVSLVQRNEAIEIQPVIIQAQSTGAETGKITLYVGDYSYDESTSTYHIYSELGLNYWAQKESENDQSFHVNLERDITLTKLADENGSTWTGISGYNATFDGQGHTIKGLTLNIKSNDYQNQGFFRSIYSKAIIRNLNLTDVHIYSISERIGAIAGYSQGRIENCTVFGTVEGNTYVGGIAGNQAGGSISGCKNYCNVQANNTAASAGGVAGYAKNCTISNCYNYETITATGFTGDVAAGGIVGNTGFGAKISGCHNSGNISGKNSNDRLTQRLCLGGIVGRLVSDSSVTDCTIKDGIKIDASYYSSWLNEKDAAVGYIVGKGTEGSGNKGEADINKIDLSSSSTSTSPQ